jgi:hypothetical protein
MAQRSTVGSALSAWSFFMRLLPFGIGMGNDRARFAQPEASLPEQALALAHRQVDLEALLEPGAQRLPVPQCSCQADVARHPAQRLVHYLQLGLAQTSRSPRALPFAQPGQTSGFKTLHPILHRARGVPQQSADLRTGQALRHQQHPVKPVIVARFFRTVNLILQSQNHRFGIGHLKWFHASMKPQILDMRNYL